MPSKLIRINGERASSPVRAMRRIGGVSRSQASCALLQDPKVLIFSPLLEDGRDARPPTRSAPPTLLQSLRMFYRSDNRTPDQMRPVNILPGYINTAEGSVLIEVGNTRVICTASVEETVPQFMRNSGKGWITAEYSMLPRATLTRTPREVTKGRSSGRTHEIQRLIGRSLRAVTDLVRLGERTIWT